MLAIGNEEIEIAPELGDTIVCPRCNMRHPVEYGEKVHKDDTRTPSTLLAFYKCGKKSYLCGINGKNIMK